MITTHDSLTQTLHDSLLTTPQKGVLQGSRKLTKGRSGKRIVFFHHISGIGGASWCLLELVRALDQSIYEIVVVLREHGPLEDELAKIGVQCHHMSRFQRISATYRLRFPIFELWFPIELLEFVPTVMAARKIFSR